MKAEEKKDYLIVTESVNVMNDVTDKCDVKMIVQKNENGANQSIATLCMSINEIDKLRVQEKPIHFLLI